MKKQSLIIEKSADGLVWGRVEFKNDLLVDSARSVGALQKKLTNLLHKLYEIDPAKIEFELLFDLTALFDYQDYLNISAIGKRAGISPALMRQYAAGIKFPSAKRAKNIEDVLNDLGNDLSKIKISISHRSKTVNQKRNIASNKFSILPKGKLAAKSF